MDEERMWKKQRRTEGRRGREEQRKRPEVRAKVGLAAG